MLPAEPFDPRMKGFRKRVTVAEVHAWLDRYSTLEPESLTSIDAHGRVLAEDVSAPCDVPGFDRSAMDGYALQGEQTFGASDYSRISFDVIGTALAGHGFDGSVGRGQAVRIMTGAPLPRGADAVLRVEDTRVKGSGEQVEAVAAVSPGKHVSPRGEDVAVGDVLLCRGRTLRPQDIAVLVATGVAEIPVVKRPSVDLIVTGDELLPAGQAPRGHQVVDSNTPLLSGLIARDGGTVIPREIVEDDREVLRRVLAESNGDAIIITGGTSVGMEDHAPEVVRELGELPIHGVAMRPSSPTGVGCIGTRPVFLLPGNPVSCLCAYDFFAGPTLRALGGRSREWPHERSTLTLFKKITSVTGRTDYARVAVKPEGVVPISVGGASILTSTTRADGFVIVPHDDEGMAAGTEVTVYHYGP